MVLGTLAVVGLALLRDAPYVATPPEPAAVASVDPARAADALAGLEAALSSADPAAAAALAPAGDAGAAALLGDLAENAGEVGLRDLELRYVDEVGPLGEDGSWPAAVEASWAFERFDAAPAEAEVRVTFRADDGSVGVVSFDPDPAPSAAGSRLPVWLSGPVRASRSRHALVVVAEGGGGLRRYTRLARAAVTRTRAVLPDWPGGLVVEVPASPEALQHALAAPAGRYDNVAAVTTAVGSSSSPAAPVHVFVNPVVLGGLGPRGAQVVMSHEAVHVATDAPRTDVPLWLLEGFADFVALRGVDLPVTRTAAQAIARVREEGLPDALPGPAEFDTGASHLGATYEAAWLAAVVLAEARGPGALVELYHRVAAGEEVDVVLLDLYGFGTRALTDRWRTRLGGLAGVDA